MAGGDVHKRIRKYFSELTPLWARIYCSYYCTFCTLLLYKGFMLELRVQELR
jgi:hypothetical protein